MIGTFNLSSLAKPLNGQLINGDVQFERLSTDTRKISAGVVFLALKGVRFDAHEFAAQAVEAGAVGLVVERALPLNVPQLIVSDSRIALGRIAEYNRTFFNKPVFAVTGSSGKTTVKEMLATVLSGQGDVLATKGNLNNDIGVPLTLLEITSQHDFAVIEMGASGPGEIAYSVDLAHPDVALVNNAMGAHLEGFGSLQGVVEAKGEIYDGLGPLGVAVINLDDPNAGQWLARTEGKERLTFGLENADADVNAIQLFQQANGCYGFTVRYQQESAEVRLNVMGRHNVANALAATCMILAAGLPLSLAASGLERACAVKGRLYSRTAHGGATIIDDTYNANPGSMKAAINVLCDLEGERWLVVGDMGELGADELAEHREIGVYAAQHGVSHLYAVGRLSAECVSGYLGAGGQDGQHFASQAELLAQLKPQVKQGVVVLVKGSRSAAMDKVVSGLTEEVKA